MGMSPLILSTIRKHFIFLFVSALGFELRASYLLGRYFYCLSHSTSPYMWWVFLKISSLEQFAQGGDQEDLISWVLGLQVWSTSSRPIFYILKQKIHTYLNVFQFFFKPNPGSLHPALKQDKEFKCKTWKVLWLRRFDLHM
jgi:hypothetical protein